MRHRIVTGESGGWRLVENPAYKPRSAEDIARLIPAA
jgi:hypothetical protein